MRPTTRRALFRWSLILICCHLHLQLSSGSTYKFKTLNCESVEKHKAEVKYCRINPISRHTNSLSMYVTLKEPIRTVTVRIKIFKRASGWKPFLIDFVVDGCAFMRNRKRYKLANWFFGFMENYTNALDYNCPLSHDIWMDNFILSNATNQLPIPFGEFLFDGKFVCNGEYWGQANASILYEEF